MQSLCQLTAPAALPIQQGLGSTEQISPICSQVFRVNHILSRNNCLKSPPFLPVLFYKEAPNPATVPRAKITAASRRACRRVCQRGEAGQEEREMLGLSQAVTWGHHLSHSIPAVAGLLQDHSSGTHIGQNPPKLVGATSCRQTQPAEFWQWGWL